VFVVFNAIGVLLNLIDYVYFPFTLKRTTGTVFKQFANESNLFKLFIEFLQNYWYLLFVFALILFLLVVYTQRLELKKPKMGWRFYLIQSLTFLLTVFLF